MTPFFIVVPFPTANHMSLIFAHILCRKLAVGGYIVCPPNTVYVTALPCNRCVCLVAAVPRYGIVVTLGYIACPPNTVYVTTLPCKRCVCLVAAVPRYCTNSRMYSLPT